ncbi:MAG: hypothetical protein U1F41_13945 [Burkholderiales bacterium]
MTTKTLLSATLGALVLASCATREISPMPFASATDCFYPACYIDVEVVEEGGVRKLKIANDGNVRMGTRQRLTAIAWNLKTPGYEFRGNSIQRHAQPTPEAPKTPDGLWDRQIVPHAWWFHSYSVTDYNTEPGILYYDLTVYPDRVVGGSPVTVTRAIMNDPDPHPQRRQ